MIKVNFCHTSYLLLQVEDGIKNSELILGEKEGQNIYYSLNTTAFQEMVKWFYNFKEKGEKHHV